MDISYLSYIEPKEQPTTCMDSRVGSASDKEASSSRIDDAVERIQKAQNIEEIIDIISDELAHAIVKNIEDNIKRNK